MADGPTVAQILKTRDAAIATCKATGEAERTKREATVPIIMQNSILAPAKLGPGGQLKMDLLEIKLQEGICKTTANKSADTALAVREAELQSKVTLLQGALEGANAPKRP